MLDACVLCFSALSRHEIRHAGEFVKVNWMPIVQWDIGAKKLDGPEVRGLSQPCRVHARPSYSGTMSIHHMVLLPTSTLYLRAKVSIPSSPMGNTDRPPGTVVMASLFRTLTGR